MAPERVLLAGRGRSPAPFLSCGSLTHTLGTLDHPLGSAPSTDIIIDLHRRPSINPHDSGYDCIGGGPVYGVPLPPANRSKSTLRTGLPTARRIGSPPSTFFRSPVLRSNGLWHAAYSKETCAETQELAIEKKGCPMRVRFLAEVSRSARHLERLPQFPSTSDEESNRAFGLLRTREFSPPSRPSEACSTGLRVRLGRKPQKAK